MVSFDVPKGFQFLEVSQNAERPTSLWQGLEIEQEGGEMETFNIRVETNGGVCQTR